MRELRAHYARKKFTQSWRSWHCQLRRIGWQVDRVTDVELKERFDGTIREIVELVMLRRAEAA